jgi:hypothetical protein
MNNVKYTGYWVAWVDSCTFIPIILCMLKRLRRYAISRVAALLDKNYCSRTKTSYWRVWVHLSITSPLTSCPRYRYRAICVVKYYLWLTKWAEAAAMCHPKGACLWEQVDISFFTRLPSFAHYELSWVDRMLVGVGGQSLDVSFIIINIWGKSPDCQESTW